MNTLLINNANQLVDALDACAMEILEYQEVMSSAKVSLQEIQEISSWDGQSSVNINLKETADYSLTFFCLLPGETTKTDIGSCMLQLTSILNGSLRIAKVASGQDGENNAVLSPGITFEVQGNPPLLLSNTGNESSCGFHVCVF